MSIKKQYGGYFLSYGKFGCIYSPNLPTSKIDRNPNLVSKISYKKFLIQEKKQHDLLKKIDSSGHYFVTYLDFQEVTEIDRLNDQCLIDCLSIDDGPFNNDETIDNIRIAKTKDKCSIVYKTSDPKYTMYNMILPYAGQNISDLTITDYKPFYVGFCNVLFGVFKLVQNKLIHYDLHDQNMIFDTKTNQFKLIDFGKLIRFVDFMNISKNDDLLAHDYMFFPPEQFAVFQLRNKKIVGFLKSLKPPQLIQYIFTHKFLNKDTNLDDYIKNVYLKQNKRLRLDEEFGDRMIEEYVGMIHDFINSKFTYNELVEQFLKTFDVWTVCFSATLFIIRDTKTTNIKQQFYNFFKNNLHSNPFLRPLPGKLLQDYIDFLLKNEIISKKEKIQLQYRYREIMD